MFSSILESHRQQRKGMPFSPNTEEMARRTALAESLQILNLYLVGHERASAVKEALKTIVIVLGDPVKPPCRQLWAALSVEDEEYRLQMCTYTLRQIENFVRRQL